jgi:hypothetical protein
MLYVYDNAIIDDIKKSINANNANPNVFLTDADNYPGILAQIQEDTITYPLILLNRDEDMSINTNLFNFSRAQKGFPAAFDNKTNTLYKERSLPINLSYTLRILSTNVADTDELARELFFKYYFMYFLTIRLPYESDRRIRFGVSVDMDYGVKRESGSFDYISSGALYQSTIHLNTEGCVYLTYVPQHLQRSILSDDIKIEPPTGSNNL